MSEIDKNYLKEIEEDLKKINKITYPLVIYKLANPKSSKYHKNGLLAFQSDVILNGTGVRRFGYAKNKKFKYFHDKTK